MCTYIRGSTPGPDPHINTVTAINVLGIPEVEILLVGIAIIGTIIPFIGIPYTMVPFGFATAEIHLSSAKKLYCAVTMMTSDMQQRYALKFAVVIVNCNYKKVTIKSYCYSWGGGMASNVRDVQIGC